MSPRQKAVGYVVFLVSLGAIGLVISIVGKPIADGLRKPMITTPHVKLIEQSVYGSYVNEYRDETHHVTCWTVGMNGISCLRDVQ